MQHIVPMKRTLIFPVMFLLLIQTSTAGVVEERATDKLWPPPAAGSVHMEALLEKTLFQVDVINLDLWLGPASADQVRRLCAATDQAAVSPDSLAAVVARSRDARVRMVLQRDVGLDRFLDGVIEDLRRANEAGLLGAEGFEAVSTGLPAWLHPLRADGLWEGDRFLYCITGDTLRTVVERRDGRVVINQTDVGPEHRRGLLGSLVAPGGGFADELLDQIPRRVCSA